MRNNWPSRGSIGCPSEWSTPVEGASAQAGGPIIRKLVGTEAHGGSTYEDVFGWAVFAFSGAALAFPALRLIMRLDRLPLWGHRHRTPPAS
jgi:hypothetical protein